MKANNNNYLIYFHFCDVLQPKAIDNIYDIFHNSIYVQEHNLYCLQNDEIFSTFFHHPDGFVWDS